MSYDVTQFDIFSLDCDKYSELTNEEKDSVIQKGFEQIFENYDNLKDLTEQSIELLTKFVSIIDESINEAEYSLIDKISSFIQVFQDFFRNCDDSDLLFKLYKNIIGKWDGKKQNIEKYLSLFQILFENERFCTSFTNDNCLEHLITYIIESDHKISMDFIIMNISSSAMQKLTQAKQIEQIFTTIVNSNLEQQKLLYLLRISFQLLKKLMKNKPEIYDELKSAQIFSKINEKLIPSKYCDIKDIYQELFEDSPRLYEVLNDFYWQQDLSINQIRDTLKDLHLNPIESFKLVQWCIPKLCTDIEALTLFMNLFNKIRNIDDHSCREIVSSFILYLSPKYDILQYDQSFYMQLLIFAQCEKLYDSILFFITFLYPREKDELRLLFNRIPKLADLFIKSFRFLSNFFDHSIIINQLVKFEMYDLLSAIYSTYVSPLYFREYLKHIANKPIYKLLLEYISNEDTKKSTIEWFSNSLADVNVLLVDPKFAKKLIKLVSKLNVSSHFFDEWVIKQPKESNIFSIDVSSFEQHIISKGNLLFIPSLVPLCKKEFTTKSLKALISLGKYALPVYLKLQSNIPNVNEIISRYLSYETFKTLLETNPNIITNYLIYSVNYTPIYRFTTNSGGFLKCESSFLSISFFIKIESFSTIKCPFLSFNGMSLSMKGAVIIGPNDEVLVENVSLHSWNKIVLSTSYKYYIPKIDIYFNESNILSLPRQSLSFESIGSDFMTSSFHIAANILTSQNPITPSQHLLSSLIPPTNVFQINGNVEYIPCYSVAQFINCPKIINMLFDSYNEELIIEIPKHLDPENLRYFYESFKIILEISNIETYLRSLEKLNTKSVTKYFLFFFLDPLFWNNYEKDSPILSLALEWIISNQKLIDFDRMIEKNILVFISFLFNYFQNVTDLFFEIMEIIYENLKSEKTKKQFITYIICENQIAFENDFSITTINKRFSNRSFFQEKMLKIIRNKIDTETAINICLKLPPESTIDIFIDYLMKQSMNYDLLCFIIQRYADMPKIWDALLGNVSLKPSVLYSFIVSLSLASSEYHEDQITALFKRMEPNIFIDQDFQHQFINLIRFQMIQIPENCMRKLVTDIQSKKQQCIYLQDYETNHSIVCKFINHRVSTNINVHIKHVELIFSTQMSSNSKIRNFLQIIASYGSEMLCFDLLPRFLETIEENYLIELVLYLQIITYRFPVQTMQFEQVITFCKDTVNRWEVFLPFLLENLNNFDEETKELFFNKFPKQVLNNTKLNYKFLIEMLRNKVVDHQDLTNQSFSLQKKKYDFSKFGYEIVKANDYESLINKGSSILPAISDTKPVVLTSSSEGIKALARRIMKVFISNSMNAHDIIKLFYRTFNIQLRKRERLFAKVWYSTQHSDRKSYHISPFSSYDSARLTIMASPFQPRLPKTEIETFKPELRILGFDPSFDLSSLVPIDFPHTIYEASSLYGPKNQHLINMFSHLYQLNEFSFYKCNLIRLSLNVPSILFVSGSKYIIIINAEYKEDLDFSRKNDFDMMEEFLMKSFGEFSLYCGKFVVSFVVTSVFSYILDGNSNSVVVQTLKNGSFILEFENDTSIPFSISKLPELSEITKNWINKKISCFDYLIQVNLRANRSFNDLSAYPIFPRCIKDAEELKELRDFGKPIQIIGNPAGEKAIAEKYQVQGFHHSENVSSPMFVAAFHIRIFPFTSYHWSINEGWDAAGRLFNSIPKKLTIQKRTYSEMTPELYGLPEILQNLNQFVQTDSLEFPDWAKTPFAFIEKHRDILENSRPLLNKWIDLFFGIYLDDPKGLNIFSQRAYYSPDKCKKDMNMYMSLFGQMPLKVFNKPHPTSEEIECLDFDQLHFTSKQLTNRYLSNITLTIDNIQLSNFNFYHTIHFDKVGKYISLTYDFGMSEIYTIYNKNLIKINSFIEIGLSATYISEKQMICASICYDCVVLWSIIDGNIINTISIPNCNTLAIDHELNVVYLGCGTKLIEYSMCGNLIRESELETEITTIAIVEHGFSISRRLIIIGDQKGMVHVLKIDAKKGFVMVKSQQITFHPISKIEFSVEEKYHTFIYTK